MKPSELFLKCLRKVSPVDCSFYWLKEPAITKEYETGSIVLEDDQSTYYACIEHFLIQNERFVVTFLKTKRQEELNRAQIQFNFVKDL